MTQQSLSSSDPYKSATSQLTSRRVADGGRQRAGSRGEGKQYNSTAEIIRMPSGSIAPLEPLDLSQAGFNRALVFALLVNCAIWGLLALAVRALFFAAGV